MTINFYNFPIKSWFKCEYTKDYLPTFHQTFYWLSIGPLVFTRTVNH